MEIVIPEIGRIEDDILLIKDDTLRETLLNVNRLVAKIEALKDNPVPSSISSGSPTTHSELSLPDYKAFYIDNDHFKEKLFPPANRSDFHEEFADELAQIIFSTESDWICPDCEDSQFCHFIRVATSSASIGNPISLILSTNVLSLAYS
ncbi:hypothetical protein Tco_0563593 [Tanacetum coccineum]